jgi:hypothetical protein
MAFKKFEPLRVTPYVRINPKGQGHIYISRPLRTILGDTFEVYIDDQIRRFGLKPGGLRKTPTNWTSLRFVKWVGNRKPRTVRLAWNSEHEMMVGDL